MLPSDHFVRMYNELFKMLEEKGHGCLQRYWMEISTLQESIIKPYLEHDALQGLYDYFEKIRVEENCDAVMTLTNDYFEFNMRKCPSLTKVTDNDAGAFELYCDHCAGWLEPLMRKNGLYYVADMISRTEPRCHSRIYTDERKAEEFRRQVKLLAEPYGKQGGACPQQNREAVP